MYGEIIMRAWLGTGPNASLL